MKKFCYLLVLCLALLTFLSLPETTLAASHVAEASAKFKLKPNSPVKDRQKEPDSRVYQLKYFLESNRSPLTSYSETIIATADEYDLPWNLVAAIAGVESGFCRIIPKYSYNCWGWNNGRFYFQNYEDGIETVSRNLRLKYFNRGLDSPEKMGFVYAPPSPTWAFKVRHYMQQIENYPLPFLAIPLSI